MSDARYLIVLRRGSSVTADELDWLPSRLRIVTRTHRVEVDHDANTGTTVPDGGVRVREIPLAAISYVEDRDPPEAHR